MGKSSNHFRKLWLRLRKSGSSGTWLLFLPGRTECHLVHAESRKGRLRIRQYVTIPAEELDEPTRLPLDDVLQTQLQRFQVVNPKVAVLLPRNAVSFARVPLPRMADSEVHETAMIQSEALFAESADQHCLDYILLPQGDGAQSLLLLHGVDRSFLQRIVAHLQTAHLQCSLVAPASSIGCSAGNTGDDRLAILIVMSDKEKIEIFAQSEGHLLSHQRRNVPVESSDDIRNSIIVGEVLRTISCINFPGPQLTSPVIRFASNGRDWTSVTKAIQAELGLPAENFETLPFECAGSENSEIQAYLELIASGVAFESSGVLKSPLNFLSPRTCLSKKERRRRNLIRIGLIAALISVCLNVWSSRSVHVMEQELTLLTGELEQLQEQLVADADVFEILDSIKKWKEDRADLQTHFSIVKQCLPESSRCQLIDLQFHQQSDDPRKLLIQINGVADRTETVVQLSQNILHNGHFRQRPCQIGHTSGDGKLIVSFQLELEPSLLETPEDVNEFADNLALAVPPDESGVK